MSLWWKWKLVIKKPIIFTLSISQEQSGSISSLSTSDWLFGSGSTKKVKSSYFVLWFYRQNSLPVYVLFKLYLFYQGQPTEFLANETKYFKLYFRSWFAWGIPRICGQNQTWHSYLLSIQFCGYLACNLQSAKSIYWLKCLFIKHCSVKDYHYSEKLFTILQIITKAIQNANTQLPSLSKIKLCLSIYT